MIITRSPDYTSGMEWDCPIGSFPLWLLTLDVCLLTRVLFELCDALISGRKSWSHSIAWPFDPLFPMRDPSTGQQTWSGGVSNRAIFKIALNFKNKRSFEGKHRLVQQTPKHDVGEHL